MSPANGANSDWRFARHVDDLTESAIFAVKAKADKLAGQGRDIVHLDAGEPDFSRVIEQLDSVKDDTDLGYWLVDELGIAMVPAWRLQPPAICGCRSPPTRVRSRKVWSVCKTPSANGRPKTFKTTE